jgi:membrane protease YdiL (CAAX protease family)
MPPPRSREDSAATLHDYWRESRRPLVSLAFISPLLIVYEGGILLLGPAAMRNGAEVWLRWFLDQLGFGQYFLLPLLTVGLLLGWHHVTRDRWYVPVPVLYGMAGECTSLALCLVAIGYVQGAILGSIVPGFAIADAPLLGNAFTQFIGKAVSFFGAGIYEEVLFRLMLLTGLFSVFNLAGVSPRRAVWCAIAVSSLLFSLAHYVGPQGDPLTLFSFLFRFVAGAFFAVLFVRRGFGIAAGTHALYDIIVGLL